MWEDRSQVVAWEVCSKSDFPRKIDVLSSSYDDFSGRGKSPYIRIYVSHFPRILTAVRRRRALTARLPSSRTRLGLQLPSQTPLPTSACFIMCFTQVIELPAFFHIGKAIPEREANDFSPKTRENSRYSELSYWNHGIILNI
jgi:hypothetical protein